MTEHIVEVELVAKRVDRYTNLVFQLKRDKDAYIMCTILPNWGIPDISVGDKGFLQYSEIYPGDEYLDLETGEIKVYRYRQNYLINFVLTPQIINKKQELIL